MMSQPGAGAACLVWPATQVPCLPPQYGGGQTEHSKLLAATWLIAAVPDPGQGGAVERRPRGRGGQLGSSRGASLLPGPEHIPKHLSALIEPLNGCPFHSAKAQGTLLSQCLGSSWELQLPNQSISIETGGMDGRRFPEVGTG